jgi:hypothetical protein
VEVLFEVVAEVFGLTEVTFNENLESVHRISLLLVLLNLHIGCRHLRGATLDYAQLLSRSF